MTETLSAPAAVARRPGLFEAIAFDLDGTLVNTLPAIHAAFNGILSPIIGRSIPVEEVVSRLGPRAVDIMRIYDPQNADTLIDTYIDYYLSIPLDYTELYPGVVELVQDLAMRGCKLGIVTSKRRRTAIPTLEHFGLLKHFAAVVTEDDVSRLKPDPEPIRMTAKAMGVDCDKLLVVGDNPTDIEAARAAGAFGAAAVWGFYGPKAAADADFAFNQPSDLLKIVAGRAG